jgi:hypothetical protein
MYAVILHRPPRRPFKSLYLSAIAPAAALTIVLSRKAEHPL